MIQALYRAAGIALAFFFVATATCAIVYELGREAGPQTVARDRWPFIEGLRGRGP